MTLESQAFLEETIRALNEELAQTNREVMALTLELEKRMEELRLAEQRYRRLVETRQTSFFVMSCIRREASPL